MGLTYFLNENQFIAGILSGVILTLVGQWLSFYVWKKQQGWTMKRNVYIEAIELLVRVHDLTRQIRSSYLAGDGDGFNNLLRTRDPLFIDIDAIAVKAGFLLLGDNVVQALVRVTSAAADHGREVTRRSDSSTTLQEQIEIHAAGLNTQATIYSEALKELRRCAIADLGMRSDLLTG